MGFQGFPCSPLISMDFNGFHGLELIAFHRTGVGVNVLLTDDDGQPIGIDSLEN